MWFLIKSTVFICMTLVVLSFFSTDETSEGRLSAAGVTSAVISAGEFVHYMSGICAEKPEVCVKGAETFAMLSERTREGAKVAYQLIEGQLGESNSARDERAAEPLATTPAATDMIADQIQTGTIVKAEPEAEPLRIPIPLKRPVGF